MSLAAIFLSKSSHPTILLELEFHPDEFSTRLLADLAAIGWDRVSSTTAVDGRLNVLLGHKGRGPDGEWTRAERPKLMVAVRRVIRRYGLTGVPTAGPPDEAVAD
jgi:hypothetical protein